MKMTKQTNEKITENDEVELIKKMYKEYSDDDIVSYWDIFPITKKDEIEAAKYRQRYKLLAPKERFKENLKNLGRSILHTPLIMASSVAFVGFCLGACYLNYRFNNGRLFGETYKGKEQNYLQNSKENSGIEVFYDRGRELITEINSLEKKIKYTKPQDSIKYAKQIDSLKEQSPHIKDGIEYTFINNLSNSKRMLEGGP